ncbi:MAG: ATP-binding protein [Candidatus Poribacteria bacterium]|nr:ATP-binding protein [Candidatus Poribacteria bacterium]
MRDLLIQDIRKNVQSKVTHPQVVRAIRDNVLNPPGIEDSVLDIIEYGDTNGLIVASKGDSDARPGVIDADALDCAQGRKPPEAIRIRTSEKRTTIEVTLPIQTRGRFLGFVTGGYFLRERLSQALSDQALHPIFLKEGSRLEPLNAPGDTIPTVEQQSLFEIFRRTDAGFRNTDLIGIPHSVSRIPILTSHLDAPAELIIAYSHRNEIELRKQLMLVLLITGGVGLIFVYVVSYVIGGQMTKPINQLAAGATEIAAGNLDHRVTVQGRDEIGGLAQTFNQMAADLKANLDKLLVAERVAAWRDVARRIAHEIKNPLFPIRLSVENLQRTYRSSPAIFDELFDECTETVIEEVERLQRMVDEFHQFARMPAPERVPSDLNQIVRNVLNLYAESATQIQIETALNADLPSVDLDPAQISQSLGNLIKNALEAMPDGGTLRVSTQLVADESPEIRIADTGIGMSAETQANIFAPYYTTKEAGTGLGMAIVQRIITDHNGEISVESEKGVGTTVRIVLPRHENG